MAVANHLCWLWKS